MIGVAATEVSLLGRRAAAQASREAGYLDGLLGVGELARQGAWTQTRSSRSSRTEYLLCSGSVVPLRQACATRPADGCARSGRCAAANGHPVDVERDGLPTTIELAVVPHGTRPGDGYFVASSGDRIVRPSLRATEDRRSSRRPGIKPRLASWPLAARLYSAFLAANRSSMEGRPSVLPCAGSDGALALGGGEGEGEVSSPCCEQEPAFAAR